MTNPVIRSVSVSPSHLPALTLSGVVWSSGVHHQHDKHHNCDTCPLLEICADAVNAGNFAGCEGVLESEIWDTSKSHPSGSHR